MVGRRSGRTVYRSHDVMPGREMGRTRGGGSRELLSLLALRASGAAAGSLRFAAHACWRDMYTPAGLAHQYWRWMCVYLRWTATHAYLCAASLIPSLTYRHASRYQELQKPAVDSMATVPPGYHLASGPRESA